MSNANWGVEMCFISEKGVKKKKINFTNLLNLKVEFCEMVSESGPNRSLECFNSSRSEPSSHEPCGTTEAEGTAACPTAKSQH